MHPPDDAAPGRDTQLTMVRWVALTLLACVPSFLAFYALAGALWSPLSAVVALAGIAVLPVIVAMQPGARLNRLAHLVLAILWFTLLGTAYFHGGAEARNMLWVPVLPVLALLLIGHRAAWFWTVVAAAHLVGFHVAALSGWRAGRVLDGQWEQAYALFAEIALMAVLLAVGLALDRARREAADSEAEVHDQLAAANARLFGLLDALPAAVLVTRDDTLTYANDSAAKLFGLEDPGDLVGRPLADCVQIVEAQTGVYGRSSASQWNGRFPTDVHLNQLDGSDTQRGATLLSAPVNDGGDVALIVVDLTARDARRARREQVERMAILGTLASGIGHEINNPLAHALLQLRALQASREASDDPEDTAALLNEVEHSLRRVESVVRTLDVFLGDTQEAPTAVDLGAALAHAGRVVGNELRHRVTFDITPAGAPLWVHASPPRLGQFLVSALLHLARLDPAARTTTHRLWIRLAAEGDSVHLHAILAGNQPLQPNGQDALVQVLRDQLLLELGGTLQFESQAQGCVMRFSLPAAPATPHTPRPTRSPSERARPRVLIVDDEALLLRALRRLLEPDFEVTTYASADDALQHLERDADFGAVLCDLMMPGTSGIEMYEAVNQRSPALARRMVFTTGGAFTPETTRFLATTANPVVRKPFDPAVLHAALAHAAAGRTAADELN